MTILSAYLDVPAYLRAPTGQEAASLLGLNTTIGGGSSVPVGTLSLPVVASAGWAAGPLWLLDGPSSEVVQVTGAADATHLTLAAPGTVNAHAPGVSASQAGAGGSLAEVVLRASAWIENYCQQGTTGDHSLFALNRTEKWGMPGRRALLDVDGTLVMRPGHFPVQSVASVAVQLPSGASQNLDLSLAQITGEGRLIEAPLVFTGAAPFAVIPTALTRAGRQWVIVTYTGGFVAGAVPYDVQQACIWMASELLSARRNPSGAATVKQGTSELVARPWRDTTGDSILLVQAKAALAPWRSW
jgi:hypothetical protein